MARQFQAQWMAAHAARRAAAAGETPATQASASTLPTPTIEQESTHTPVQEPVKPKMWKPWNESKNRIYDNPAHFVEVVYKWYRVAWFPNPEAELKQMKGQDDRGLDFVTISCPYDTTPGIKCDFSFTARAIRQTKSNVISQREARSAIPGTQSPALSSANTSAGPRTSLSNRGDTTSCDKLGLVDHQAASTSSTITSRTVPSYTGPPKGPRKFQGSYSNLLPGTGSNSTPIAKSNNRLYTVSSTLSDIPVPNYKDSGAASQLPSSYSADPVKQSNFPISQLDALALAAVSSSDAESTTSPWNPSSGRTSPLPFPPQKIITSPPRPKPASFPPTLDTESITPDMFAETANKVAPPPPAETVPNVSVPSEPVSASGLASNPTSAFYSVTTVTKKSAPLIAEEIAPIPLTLDKIAIALPPKAIPPSRKSPIDIIVGLPSVKLPTSASEAVESPREATNVVDTAQQVQTMPSAEGPSVPIPKSTPARYGSINVPALPSFKRMSPVLPNNNALPITSTSQPSDKINIPSSTYPKTTLISGLYQVETSTLFNTSKKTSQAGRSNAMRGKGSAAGSTRGRPYKNFTPTPARDGISPTSATSAAPAVSATSATTVASATSAVSPHALTAAPPASATAAAAATAAPASALLPTSLPLASSSKVSASHLPQAQAPAQVPSKSWQPRNTAPPAVTASSIAHQMLKSTVPNPAGPKANTSDLKTSVSSEPSSAFALLNKEKTPIEIATEQNAVNDSARVEREQATVRKSTPLTTERTSEDCSIEPVLAEKNGETHFERRKPEKLTIRSTSKNYRKEPNNDKQGIDSINLLAAFEGSASPANSPSHPAANSMLVDKSIRSTGSPGLLTGITSVTDTSSARSSRSPLAREHSSDTSVPGDENQMVIDSKTTSKDQAGKQIRNGIQHSVPRMSTPNIGKRAQVQAPPAHLVIKIESDASDDIDELKQSHMDIDNNDASFGLATPKSSVACGTADLVSTAPSTPPISAIKAALSLAIQPSLQKLDFHIISRDESREGTTHKDQGEKRKAAEISSDSKSRPSPSRLTFSDIEAMSSSEGEHRGQRDLPSREKKVVDEETTLVNSSNGKKKQKKKKIMLSETESEEEVPIAQLAASLSSAASTPTLQQDLPTMQVDFIVHKEAGPSSPGIVEETNVNSYNRSKSAQGSTILPEIRKRKQSPSVHKREKTAEKKSRQNHNDDDIADNGKQKEQDEPRAIAKPNGKLQGPRRCDGTPEGTASLAKAIPAAKRQAAVRKETDEIKERQRIEEKARRKKEKTKRRNEREAKRREAQKKEEEEEERLKEEKLKKKEEKRRIKAEKAMRKEGEKTDSRTSPAEYVLKQEPDKQAGQCDESMQIDGKGKGRERLESSEKKDKKEVLKSTKASPPPQTMDEVLAASELEVFLPCVRYVKAFHELGFRSLSDLKKAGILPTEGDMFDLIDMMAGLDFTRLETGPNRNPIRLWATQRAINRMNGNGRLTQAFKPRTSLSPVPSAK